MRVRKVNNYHANYTVSIQELIESEEKNIFNFPYDSLHKEELEKRFIDKYYFKEIGYETYTMWHYKFKERWLRRIKHYQSLFAKYVDIDPLLDYNEVREYLEDELNNTKEDIVGSNTGSASGTSEVKQKDTPITAYDDSDYISFKGNDSSESTSENSSTANSLKDIIRNMNGKESKKIMTANQLVRLNEYVNGYMDILDRFLNEFIDLFIGMF